MKGLFPGQWAAAHRFTCSARKVGTLWLWMVGVCHIRKFLSKDLKHSVLKTHRLSIIKWSLLVLKVRFPVCRQNDLCYPGPTFLIPPIPPLIPSPLTSAASDYSVWVFSFLPGERERFPFLLILSKCSCSPHIYSWPSLCNVLLTPTGELSKQSYLCYYPIMLFTNM